METYTFQTPLEIGERVAYTTDADWGCATGSGIYLGVALDEEDGVPYHYFADGEINGLAQRFHGFPAEVGTPTTTDQTPTLLTAGWAAHKAVAASQERDHAIRTAHAAGNTIRAIAAVCGLSAARVHQILHK